jgi:Undecaprenyl-phosphate galactose phosphotransferase WbaP
MNQLYKQRTSAVVMIMADGFGFIAAGGLALAWAISINHAQIPSLADAFEFDTRNRIIDFVYGALVWVTWFHLVKNRYRKRMPYWSEQAETIKGAMILALVNLAFIALARNDYSRTLWLSGWFLLILTIPITRSFFRYLLSKAEIWQTPTWIIGSGLNASEARLALESEWQMGFSIQGQLNLDGQITDDTQRMEKFETWLKSLSTTQDIKELSYVLALEDGHSTTIAAIVQTLTILGARKVYVIPDIRGIPLYGADINYFFSHEVLLLRLKNNLESRASKLIKRVFDVLVALLLALPAILVVAGVGLLIVLEDGLPIFYSHQRLGRSGKTFRMYKLRSMRKDADLTLELWKTSNSSEWQDYCANNNKIKDDPRLLKTGHWIRKFSIDELPQLFNVIRGDMSLVGPRPILASEAEQYGENIVLYYSTRPALTGLWQVSGRSDATFDQRSNLDAWYIRNWSIGFDIVILLRTFAVVLFRKGAY